MYLDEFAYAFVSCRKLPVRSSFLAQNLATYYSKQMFNTEIIILTNGIIHIDPTISNPLSIKQVLPLPPPPHLSTTLPLSRPKISQVSNASFNNALSYKLFWDPAYKKCSHFQFCTYRTQILYTITSQKITFTGSQ